MRFLKEPLFHFFIAGVALFFLYHWVESRSSSPSPSRIVVSRADIDRLAKGFAAQWRRPPSEQDLQGLIDAEVRERVLYREALALGLDKDDTIVRRRMAQKVEFLLKDTLALRQPTESELIHFLDANAGRYRIPSDEGNGVRCCTHKRQWRRDCAGPSDRRVGYARASDFAA